MLHIYLHSAIILVASITIERSCCSAFQILRIEKASNSLLQALTSATSRRIHSATSGRSRSSRSNDNETTRLYSIKGETEMINGSKSKSAISFFEGMDVAALPEGGELTMTVEPKSPPITFDKFVTMQEKRAVVTIRYSGDAGLKPYFLTIAKKLKQSHPDIVIERRILPSVIDGNYEATFEVLVEGKVVLGKSRHRKVSRNGNNDVHDIIGRRSVYVSMNELGLAISRARRKHRPTTTVYGNGDNDTSAIVTSNKQRNNSKVYSGTNTGMKNIDTTPGRTDWSD